MQVNRGRKEVKICYITGYLNKAKHLSLCNILEILHMCKTGRQLLYRAASGTVLSRTLVLLVYGSR